MNDGGNPCEQLIDGHAHLAAIEAVGPVLQRAAAVGVRRVIAVGMDMASNRRTLQLAERFGGTVCPCIGYHPWSITATAVEAHLQFVAEHLQRCVGLGEVGLDYKVKVKKNLQVEVFAQLLQAAVRQAKPVIVHSRFSHRRCHAMVAGAGVANAVFHWYSGPLDILDRILADGYHVSCTPALAHSPPHRAAMGHAPLERILIETDCPVAYQGQPSEPAHLLHALHHLSRLKNISPAETAAAVTENARRVFGLGDSGPL